MTSVEISEQAERAARRLADARGVSVGAAIEECVTDAWERESLRERMRQEGVWEQPYAAASADEYEQEGRADA